MSPVWKNIVKIVICVPTKHLGVLLNSFKHVRAFQIELEFGSVGFEERGKPEYPEKNLSEQERKPKPMMGGSLVYIMLIGKLRHQHAMVSLAAAINTGGG